MPLLKFASGPIVFALLYAIPYEGMVEQGRLALAVFGWMIAWWMARPVPWAAASLLPLVLFPMFNVMTVGANGRAIRPEHFLLDLGNRF